MVREKSEAHAPDEDCLAAGDRRDPDYRSRAEPVEIPVPA